MPERLNEDQRHLYECLKDIWLTQSRKVILAIAAALGLALGITVGTLSSTQKTLRETGEIARNLHLQVEQNRRLIESQSRDQRLEQQRYENLLAAFEAVKRQVLRQRAGK